MIHANKPLAEARSETSLFEPVTIGALSLKNRIVMAPLTRNRAAEGLVPGPHAATYYSQRASAGLIIAEATQISAQAQGYADTPGCYSEDQIKGWKAVTDAVHEKGGTIILQIWHTGRMSHTSFQKNGAAPIAPSAVRAQGKTFIKGEGFVDVSTPRALLIDEIPGIIADFRHAAQCAMRAGFDGVEIHAAHGYLIDSFLRNGANQRRDAYGGSIENRARFLIETVAACADAIGADRLGVRLSPVSPAGDSQDSNPQALFNHVVEQLNAFPLAYLHVVEGATGGKRDHLPFDYEALHQRFDGAWMLNNGYDRDMAIKAIAEGRADLISFGRPFIANPDLVARLRDDAPLNPLMDPSTFYGGDAHGYIDYPTLTEAAA
ncbi:MULTISPECIES: alkene reductase [unclassified Iodidimonas]|uniref:alkene reductase n=1 Tax=unclassified Iodidimonas TaxID=2626145 RepID=UPI002482D28C|nr:MULTISPECIES: alkene reductase [unclassified Iodidimonas]